MSTFALGRGIAGSPFQRHIPSGTPGTLSWSNVDFRVTPLEGNNAIDLILRLLMSTGTGENKRPAPATNYDVYEKGVGLGIPHDQIDIASFTTIKDQHDFDINQQLFFLIQEPESAREFIENELCRPFGIYLATGNDGRIRCVRPRHPQKFYIGDANRRLRVNTPDGVQQCLLDIGVFDAFEMCANINKNLKWSVGVHPDPNRYTYSARAEYSTTTHKFSLRLHKMVGSQHDDPPGDPVAFDLEISSDLGWQTLGWTAGVTNVDPEEGTTAHETRGDFSCPLLTDADLSSVRQLDNLEDRITSVVYAYDYDPDWCDRFPHGTPVEEIESAPKQSFRNSRTYPAPPDPEQEEEDPTLEYVDLGDTFGRQDYLIASRGLVSGGTASAAWVRHFTSPGGCEFEAVLLGEIIGLNADTWALLYARTLADRYRQPPIKFRARLPWSWNHLEVGDVVRVTYSTKGVFTDPETKLETLSGRLFEIVALRPVFEGAIEAVFLSHRKVSY